MNVPFLFIAGHPALDFLNTEKGSDTGERVELLAEPESVAAWFEVAGFPLIPAHNSLLSEARALRDAIRALVTAWINDAPAPAEPLALLNRTLASGASQHQLKSDFTQHNELLATNLSPLLPIAESALELLTQQDKTLVRQCAGTGCILWFLDTTKNKRRRWCRMEACGNRAKVSAHYHRQREDV